MQGLIGFQIPFFIILSFPLSVWCRNSPLDMKPADSSVYQPLDQAEPPTSLTPLVSPKAIKADRSPVSPGSLGMPCKRTIFPPPRSALSPSREEPSPSKAELGEDNEIRPSSGQEGSRRGRLQETRKTRDALFTIGKVGTINKNLIKWGPINTGIIDEDTTVCYPIK